MNLGARGLSLELPGRLIRVLLETRVWVTPMRGSTCSLLASGE
jgi:hypothetical protein